MSRTFSIGIIDDHLLFAQSLSELMQSFDFIDKVKICPTPTKTGYFPPLDVFHLILIDISLPYMNGFRVFETIQKARPYQKMAFISSQEDRLTLARVKELGPRGYIIKRLGKGALENALRRMLIENAYAFPTNHRQRKRKATTLQKNLTQKEEQLLRELLYVNKNLNRSVEVNLKDEPLTLAKEKLLRNLVTQVGKNLHMTERMITARIEKLNTKFNTTSLEDLVKEGLLFFKAQEER